MPIAENIFSKDKKSSAFYKKVWYTVWCDGYSAGASPRPTGSHGICRTSVWKLACFALQNRRHPLPSRQFHEVRHSEKQSNTAFTRTMVDALWFGNWRVLLCKTDDTHCRRDNFTKCGTASNKATLNLSVRWLTHYGLEIGVFCSAKPTASIAVETISRSAALCVTNQN